MEHMLFMKTEIAIQIEIFCNLHEGKLFNKELSSNIDWWEWSMWKINDLIDVI